MRTLAGLLVIAALLAGAGAFVDAMLTRTAQEQAARRVSDELGGAETTVELRGFPVSARLLGGQVPQVTVTATGAAVEGSPVEIARLEATVDDVRVRFADLRGDGPLPIDGGAGVFSFDLDEENANRAIAFPGGVRLGDGVATVEVGGQQVEVLPTVEEGQVVLRPMTAGVALPPIPVDLPQIPAQIEVGQVVVSPGLLTVTGRVLQLSR